MHAVASLHSSSFLEGVQSSIEDSVIDGLQSSCATNASIISDSCDQSVGNFTITRRSRNFNLPSPSYHNLIYLSNKILHIPEACCSKQCLLNFSPNEIRSLQSSFLNSSEIDQRQNLVSAFANQATRKRVKQHSSVDVVRTNFVLKGKSVCPFAFCQLQGVSKYKYACAERSFLDGHTTLVHGNKGRIILRNKTAEALAWMRFFLERVGDFMPHNHKIFVPPAYNYTTLYDRMKKDFSERGIDEVISYGYFTTILHTQLPDFVLGKVSTFTKCTVCTNIKEERQRATTSEERDAIKKLHDLHIKHVELSRKHYHQCRERARAEPSMENTLIIDGMDQSKTNLPSLLIEDKATKPVPRLRSHITGALFHTDGPGGLKAYAFTDIHTVPDDSNLTIHVMLQVLADNPSKKEKKLNVQMDNCFRENKNRYLLGLGFLMVEINLYEQVDFNFLPVGHTHEDVDQFFSRIAEKLRFNNAYTLNDLHHIIEKSYTPKVNVKHIRGPEMFNVKDWIFPHLEQIGNHSKPHHFRFCKVNGITQMYYKVWCCDPWRPNDVEMADPDVSSPSCAQSTDGGLILLKDTPDIEVAPNPVVPSLEKLDPDLSSIVPSFQRRLPDTAKTWWLDFLDNLNVYTEPLHGDAICWPLLELHLAHSDNHPPRDFSHLNRLEEAVVQDCPQVNIGSNRQKRAVTRVDDFLSMSPGMTVAVYVRDKPTRPQIGRLLQIEDNWMKIHWYSGQWSTSQKPSFSGAGKNRKPVTEWLDEKCALLWDFALTSKNSALTKATQLELKARYSEIEQVVVSSEL